MSLLPWMEMGWTVVNVEYRLARVALAPAAVEDCLCALRFIAAQAKTYNIDTNAHRADRRIGGRSSDADDRHDSGERRARPRVRRRDADSESGGDGQLVRHHRRRRRDRRSARREPGGDVVRQPAEQGRNRQTRVAADVRPARAAADPDDSRRSWISSCRTTRPSGCTPR